MLDDNYVGTYHQTLLTVYNASTEWMPLLIELVLSDVAKLILDRCVTTSEEPADKEFCIELNFKLFDDPLGTLGSQQYRKHTFQIVHWCQARTKINKPKEVKWRMMEKNSCLIHIFILTLNLGYVDSMHGIVING